MAEPTPTPQNNAAYLVESAQPNLYAAVIASFGLSVIAVTARLWCRRYTKAGFWLDDGLIILALLWLIALTSIAIWLIVNGQGRHIEALGPDAESTFYHGYLLAEVFYIGTIVFVKYSILALYWRIFGKLVKWEVFSLSIIVTLWGLAVFITEMLSCQSLAKYWDRTLPGVCNVSDEKFFYSVTIPNVVTDIAILTVPIRHVMKLKLARHQKISLACVFLLGGFVCIASIIRMVVVITSELDGPDPTWSFIDTSIWSPVECNTAVISACLPCLRPAWKRLRRSSSITNEKTTKATKTAKTRPTGTVESRPGRAFSGLFRKPVQAPPSPQTSDDELPFQSADRADRQIRVVTDVSISSIGGADHEHGHAHFAEDDVGLAV